MSRVLSLAKELVKLSLSGDEQDPLTNLRLQKLLYYAQAWSLVLRESELFPDDLEAWRYGPVVPAVYRALPDEQGANNIQLVLFANVPDLEAEDAAFINSIWQAYNQYSAIKLSEMTHEETPWRKAWGERPKGGYGNEPIRIEDLEEFFGKQPVPAPLVEYRDELRRREEQASQKIAEIAPLDLLRMDSAANSFTPASRGLTTAGG